MFRLLKCVAGAVVKNGGKFLLNLIPGGEALADIAADAWENWRQQRDETALRAEIQALAQAPGEQVRAAAQAVVAAEAATLPPPVQEALTAYLTQVPAMIRRSLRRFSDPTGTTVPATQSFRGGEDLLPFLPPRPPRFKGGDLAPGLDWVLLELLGVGGFGEVWKARHRYLTSEPFVALKFCLDDSEAASKALRNEAGILDRVKRQGRHSAIVTLRQTHFSARPPCLEYEYVEGGDLTGLIQELREKGQLTPRFATRVLLTLAQTVGFAHRATPAIVHCDLKPANVLVQRNAKGELVLRITDFGIGGLAAGHAINRTRLGATSRSEMVTEAVRGAYTPFYAPPEQIGRRRDQSPDPRDDIHALGMIWYQLLTGSLGLTSLPSDWREEVQERGLSAAGIQLLSQCIAPKPEKRPATAVELADQLSKLLGEPSPPAVPNPKPSPPPATPQNQQSVVATVAPGSIPAPSLVQKRTGLLIVRRKENKDGARSQAITISTQLAHGTSAKDWIARAVLSPGDVEQFSLDEGSYTVQASVGDNAKKAYYRFKKSVTIRIAAGSTVKLVTHAYWDDDDDDDDDEDLGLFVDLKIDTK